MPQTAADLMRDGQIDHAVDLRAYTDNVVRRMITILNRADSALFSELIDQLSRIEPSEFSMERLEALLASVREINAAAHERVHSELTGELAAFTEVEVDAQAAIMKGALPSFIQIARVSPDAVHAAAMSRPFQGNLLKGFLDDIEESRAKLIRREVADGFVQGKTTDQIVRTLRGTRSKGYADGLLEQPRHQVATVVRTAISHTAGFARDRMWEANNDLMKGYQWLSTLDARTSSLCQVRDGLRYSLEKKPVGHAYPWGAGPGRIHWNCRSTNTPIFKSLAELAGIEQPKGVDEDYDRDRASMDGSVSSKTTYAEWLAKQSEARQKEVLGPTRAALFRDGGLELKDLYSARGEELTLDDLRKKVGAKAFRKAGV